MVKKAVLAADTKTNVVLYATSIVLSLFTVILGAIPLRLLRLKVGAVKFMALVLLAVAAFSVFKLYEMAVLYLAYSILVTSFTYFEEKSFNLVKCGLSSVLLTTGALALGFFVWFFQNQQNWYTQVQTYLSSKMDKVAFTDTKITEELYQSVIYQMPSGVIIILALGLFVALAFERRLKLSVGLKGRPSFKLADFTLPDFMVWILIASLPLSFSNIAGVPEEIRVIATNVFYISMLCYFFQGMAVVQRYFELFKIGMFWRLLWLFILVSHIYSIIFVAVLGIADVWLNFRLFFAKQIAKFKNKN
ncbi:MAG: YybS family protein [Bdellovibrionales bacterium]|nr:YybS family protein [Bdellovibrionales bacterium]